MALLDAERVTLLAMQAAAQERSARLAESLQAAEAGLAAARDQVRLLRDELVGPSNAPSLSQVQERLTLESRLRAQRQAGTSVRPSRTIWTSCRSGSTMSGPSEPALGKRLPVRRIRPHSPPSVAASSSRSRPTTCEPPPGEVTIDERTLLPVDDGFELSFDVALGFSASDAIRTKWAYHTVLFEMAAKQPRGRHLGFLALHHRGSRNRITEASPPSLTGSIQIGALGQVIYVISERRAFLADLLRDIPL